MKKEGVLIDNKSNLNNTSDCQKKTNVILADIKRTVLSLEINELFMELQLALG